MILSINTTTVQFGLCLLTEDGTITAEYLIAKSQKHFRGFMPSLDFIMSGVGAGTDEIKAVVAALGPGSFTGLRVGIAAAKGLCHALNIPLVGVSSLEALAYQFPCPGFLIAPLITSRRGEIFTAPFAMKQDNQLVRQGEDKSIPFERLPEIYRGKTIFIGNDFSTQSKILRDIFRSEPFLAPAHLWNLKASSLGLLGIKRLEKGITEDPGMINPIYLRPPDIRPNPYFKKAD
jgi:tRNA threonylcarbamoyladenosine biosynthesis protein TsaB